MANNSHIKTKMYKHGDNAHSESYAKEGNVIGEVIHGNDSTVARPTGYSSIQWKGSVSPDHATDNDSWVYRPESE